MCGETSLTVSSRQWKTYKAVITAKATADTHLEIIPQSVGELNLDMISLFPQNTFKGRKNGLRKDLAQVLADIHPRFIRFPGGCVAHGDGLKNIYQWKNTVGPLEAEKHSVTFGDTIKAWDWVILNISSLRRYWCGTASSAGGRCSLPELCLSRRLEREDNKVVSR